MKKEVRHGGNVLQLVASKPFQRLAGEDAGQVQHEKTYRYVKYEAQQRGRLDERLIHQVQLSSVDTFPHRPRTLSLPARVKVTLPTRADCYHH